MERQFFSLAFAVFSIAAIPAAVKAQTPTSADLKDSVKSEQSGLSKLISVVLNSGKEREIPNGMSQAIGLEKPSPSRVVGEIAGDLTRKCAVVYSAGENGQDRAICLFVFRTKKSEHDLEESFLQVNLDGTLVKAITLRNKVSDDGKVLREGRTRSVEDIESPEVQKRFKADMSFWVNDWLKRQQKLAKKVKAAAESSAK